MWLVLAQQETGVEQEMHLNQIASLWLHGLRPAEVELTQPAAFEDSLQLCCLRKILQLAVTWNLTPNLDSDTGAEMRANLKVLLMELEIPARFEP